MLYFTLHEACDPAKRSHEKMLVSYSKGRTGSVAQTLCCENQAHFQANLTLECDHGSHGKSLTDLVSFYINAEVVDFLDLAGVVLSGDGVAGWGKSSHQSRVKGGITDSGALARSDGTAAVITTDGGTIFTDTSAHSSATMGLLGSIGTVSITLGHAGTDQMLVEHLSAFTGALAATDATARGQHCLAQLVDTEGHADAGMDLQGRVGAIGITAGSECTNQTGALDLLQMSIAVSANDWSKRNLDTHGDSEENGQCGNGKS